MFEFFEEEEEKKEDAPAEEGGDAEGGEDGEGGEGDDGKDRRKKKLMLIGLLVLMLVGGALIGTFVVPALTQSEEAAEDGEYEDEEGEDGEEDGEYEEEEAEEEEAEEEGDDHGEEGEGKEGADAGPAFLELPEFVVDLHGTGRRTNFLKLRLSLQVDSEADKVKLEKLLPRIIDKFHVYLRELRVQDLRGSAGLYRLREELLTRGNAVTDPVVISDVLFQEMLVQ